MFISRTRHAVPRTDFRSSRFARHSLSLYSSLPLINHFILLEMPSIHWPRRLSASSNLRLLTRLQHSQRNDFRLQLISMLRFVSSSRARSLKNEVNTCLTPAPHRCLVVERLPLCSRRQEKRKHRVALLAHCCLLCLLMHVCVCAVAQLTRCDLERNHRRNAFVVRFRQTDGPRSSTFVEQLEHGQYHFQ